MNSHSEKFREQGNEVFKQCTDSLPSVIYISRLIKALQLYESARDTAHNDDERASALKNIGVASNRMALKEPEVSNKGFYYLRALESLTKASIFGKKTKSPNWRTSIQDDIIVTSLKALAYFEGYKCFEERQNFVYKIKSLVPSNLIKIHIQIRRSLVLGNLRWALSLFEEKNYRKVLKVLYDSSQYLEEGLSLCRESSFDSPDCEFLETYDELKEKKESFEFLIKRAEALKEMASGNDLLEKAVNDEESLIMDFIWDALDHFKHASILCKEKDIEIEAQLYGRIGFGYYKVLKLTKKAKDYFEASIRLALSLGRNLSGKEWYEQINGYLREIREEEMKKENSDLSKRREKLVEVHQKEIEELEKARKDKTHQDFIKFILQKYPPKGQTFELLESSLETSKMKKTLLNVIRVYHPDKQPQNDEKWCFIAEEISKLLTSIYEVYKT